MLVEELKQAMKTEYRNIHNSKFSLGILTKPPVITLRYEHPTPEYENPPDSIEFFRQNPDHVAFRASDGFYYFNSETAVRMLDLSDDIARIVAMDEVANYLKTVGTNGSLNLVPAEWRRQMAEGGTTNRRIEDKLRKDADYASLTFSISGQDNPYSLNVGARRDVSKKHIDISVIVTRPEAWHFDGQDSINYPIYLYLVRGKVFDDKALNGLRHILSGHN